MQRRAVSGFPWPEVTAYRRIEATPAQVVAVYADVARQAEWVPDLVTTRVISREAPNVLRVFYEYEVAGPNEQYTVALTVGPTRDGWEIRWKLIRARYARRLEGSLRAAPLGAATLIEYTSRVDPGTLGVTFGTPDSVATRLARTAEALGRRVGALRMEAPGELGRLVERLEAMATPDRR